MLPVSGVELAVHEPTGQDELYLVETTLAPVPAVLGLARRIVRTITGDSVDWASLPASDLAAAALIIRRSWLGDTILTDATCPAAGCRERIDVGFSITEFLAAHRPRRYRGVVAAPEAGWFALAGTAVRFRVPTVGDLLSAGSAGQAASTAGQAAGELTRRCVDPPEISRALAARLDRALSALAPSLDDLVGGACPGCGHQVALRFDPVGYTLAELRTACSDLHRETHAIAAAYGWPEDAILALPRRRRQRYASIIDDERAVA